MQPVKLILSYDMKPGREESCQRFMVQEVGGMLNEYGFQFTDAWYTAWGNGPQIMGGGLLENEDVARDLLQSAEWNALMSGLRRYADNFSVRVVEPTGTFQI